MKDEHEHENRRNRSRRQAGLAGKTCDNRLRLRTGSGIRSSRLYDVGGHRRNFERAFCSHRARQSIVIRLPTDAKDVLIGNPEIVDVVVRSRKTAYLFARKTGQTNAFFFDAAGRQILSLDIEV